MARIEQVKVVSNLGDGRDWGSVTRVADDSKPAPILEGYGVEDVL